MLLVKLLTVESLTKAPDELISMAGSHISRRCDLPSSITPPKRFQANRPLFFTPDPLLFYSLPFGPSQLASSTFNPLDRQQSALLTLQKDLIMQTCSRASTDWHCQIHEVRVLRDPLVSLTTAHRPTENAM